MSTVSPGSKTTTNVFIVLGIAVLIALALAVNNKSAEPEESCAQRLVQEGSVVWDPYGAVIHPGEVQVVALTYQLQPDGSIENIAVSSTASPYDETAVRALKKSRFSSAEGSTVMRCSHVYTLKLE